MLFSVIVPVYNVEKYLKKCVDSLLSQNFADMEVILVDDKSTDHSLQIAEAYQGHPNVKVIAKEKNSGLSDTRNVGLQAAAGQYILFLDSDDYIEDGSMAKIAETIKQANEPGIVYFGYYEEYEGTGRCFKKYGYVSEKNHLYKAEDFMLYEMQQRKLCAPVWLGVYKRELILDNNLFFQCGILHEDELWTPQAVLKAGTVYTSEYAYYHYLRRAGSITKQNDKARNGLDMLHVCRELDVLAKNIEDPVLKKYMGNHIAMLYMTGMTEGKLYRQRGAVDRFFPLKRACIPIDRVKAAVFAVSLRLFSALSALKKTEEQS